LRPRPCRTQCDKLRARAAGEVVEVHSDEGAPRGVPHRGTHRVDAVFVGARVGVLVDRPPSKLDELEVRLGGDGQLSRITYAIETIEQKPRSS
jgi:hypothetical protein